MSYFIFDLETTTYESCRKKANPFDPRNKVVLFAAKYSVDKEVFLNQDNPAARQYFLNAMKTADVIIGHNIKFDLLYMFTALYNDLEFKQALKSVQIYDTMFAEYLITAQQAKYYSLNEASLKYGGTLKDDRIKEYWDAGIQTDEIPQDLLSEYAKHDILNTEIVYLAQQDEISKLGIEKLIKMNMDDLLATTLMEWHGLKIDSDLASDLIADLGEPNYDALNAHLPTNLPFQFNWQSNDHLSAFLFGGSIKYIEKEAIGTYKTGQKAGQTKYKNVEKDYKFKNRAGFVYKQGTKKTGVYKVDDASLSSISIDSDLYPIVKTILEQRDKAKQINTYYKPMIELSQHDGLLHAELVHVQTNTGRLSSRNPNIQNWSKGSESDIKSCVVSRWGKGGYIVEIDAMQLEIVCQAYLSNDPRMLTEIDNGTDFHCLRLATKKGLTYEQVYANCKVKKLPEWDKERTLTKAFSFQRAYGAGVFKIAAATGLTEEAVKELIATEKELFPEVERFNSQNILDVEYKAFVLNDEGHKGSYLSSITGRRYFFEDEVAPEWLQDKGIRRTFSPTQIKNYPIQGFGAECLAFLRGELSRKLLLKDEKVLLINTVHDSILFDVRKEIIHQFIPWVLEFANGSFKRFTEYFNIPYTTNIKYEAKYGPNWKNLVEYKED